MNDAENASVFCPHFHRVFINHRSIDWPVLDNIKQIYVLEKLDHSIPCYEINKATTKLANNKAPGLNGVPRNVFNTLDVVNIYCLLIFYNQFWHIQADFDKWNEGQAVHVTKKSNTPYPNKWRGFTSMDIGKISIAVLCVDDYS